MFFICHSDYDFYCNFLVIRAFCFFFRLSSWLIVCIYPKSFFPLLLSDSKVEILVESYFLLLLLCTSYFISCLSLLNLSLVSSLLYHCQMLHRQMQFVCEMDVWLLSRLCSLWNSPRTCQRWLLVDSLLSTVAAVGSLVSFIK